MTDSLKKTLRNDLAFKVMILTLMRLELRLILNSKYIPNDITALKKSCMAGRNIGKKYIIAVNRLIRCCFSSFCGVSTYKFNRYPSSQASADPTSDVHIVAFPFSIYIPNVYSNFIQYFCVAKDEFHSFHQKNTGKCQHIISPTTAPNYHYRKLWQIKEILSTGKSKQTRRKSCPDTSMPNFRLVHAKGGF